MSTNPPGFDPNPQFGGASTPPTSPQSGDTELPAAKPAVEGTDLVKVGPFSTTVELQLDTWHNGYTSHRLDAARINAARLTRRQAVALKMLTLSLNQQAQRFDGGRFVQNSADALRYVLDRIADQLPPNLFENIVE